MLSRQWPNLRHRIGLSPPDNSEISGLTIRICESVDVHHPHQALRFKCRGKLRAEETDNLFQDDPWRWLSEVQVLSCLSTAWCFLISSCGAVPARLQQCPVWSSCRGRERGQILTSSERRHWREIPNFETFDLNLYIVIGFVLRCRGAF